jgi:hypothetical protein
MAVKYSLLMKAQPWLRVLILDSFQKWPSFHIDNERLHVRQGAGRENR